MASAAKDRVISKVYYDVASGLGSIADTLRKTKVQDQNITREDVKTCLDKQEVRQKTKPKTL